MRNVWIVLLSFFLVACGSYDHQIQGYVEGRYAYIATSFSGILKQLPVKRGDQIQVGQTLFILELQPESETLKQAAAKLALAKTTLEHRQTLIKTNAIQQEALDTAQSDYLQAEAAFSQAQWAHQQKTMLAPNAALVFDTYYLPGELVPAGKPVLSLLAPQDIKIIFFVSELQLNAIQIGQQIAVSCDGCQQRLNARITFIAPQAEYTPPVIYTDDRRPKLVYRVEASPTQLSDAVKLHPGQPVNVHYE